MANYDPINCARCGKETVRNSGTQQYCLTCSDIVRHEKNRVYMRRVAERRKAQRAGTPLDYGTAPCAECGKEIKKQSSNHRYCRECADVVKKRSEKNRVRSHSKLRPLAATKTSELPLGVLDATEYEKRVRKFVPPPIVCLCAECGAEVRNVPPYLTDCVRVVCNACGGQIEQSGALPSWLLIAAREYGVNCEVNGIGAGKRGAA